MSENHFPGVADVVVSGISGKFPMCENVEEFKQKLFTGEDLTVENTLFKIKDERFPDRFGKVAGFEKFDASYFNILPLTADSMDPHARKLMEAAYEAIVDAGINPDVLRGSPCGVYVSTSPCESNQAMFEPLEARSTVRTTFTVSTCMMAQRISFWLGVTGPSLVIDSGCSGSLYAMDRAIQDLKSGVCDSALVGGANMITFPYITRLMAIDTLLSKEGRCKPYDAAGDGFVRAEAVVMIFLQKSDVAKRIYCRIINVRCGTEGYKEEGIAHTSKIGQVNLLQLCYADCKLDPVLIDYVEGHGPGTAVGDPDECAALDAVLNDNRKGPLVIGSVKSNMGHSEHVAGLCSLVKLIIAMESGRLPGTTTHKLMNPNIPSLLKGRLKVCNVSTPFNATYCAINSFGLGGAIAHMIIKRHNQEKPSDREKSLLPWLVACSGRTKEAVNTILESIAENPIDPEFNRLIHDMHNLPIINHLHRGFIVRSEQGKRVIQETASFTDGNRPICFVFSGMGSQWPEMGTDLLNFPVFAASMARLDIILSTKAVDIYKILIEDKPGLFQHILNAFVGITAVQISLVDLLLSLGIRPSYLIGHSFGELACAYADGVMTAEQTIMASFYRGLVSVETALPPGAMAAVGMGYEEIKDQLPDDVFVACHNSSEFCTISGRKQAVNTFCERLRSRQVFVKTLDVCGIPYHTPLIGTAVQKYLKYLEDVIKQPKERSSRWISSSIPINRWQSPLAKTSSPEYHSNNFLSPVLFSEAIEQLPKNSVLVEIAPHRLLEAIFKRMTNSSLTYIGLTDRNSDDNAETLLSGIGRIYMAGGQPKIWKLYPNVKFPVSAGTRMISPLVRWSHDRDWYLPKYEDYAKNGTSFFTINSAEPYAREYIQDGVQTFPVSACLVMVWEGLADILGVNHTSMPVIFQDIIFKSRIVISGRKTLKIFIQKDTDVFTVSVDDETFMIGSVSTKDDVEREWMNVSVPSPIGGLFSRPMLTADVYKELSLRGLVLENRFKTIKSIDDSVTVGGIQWNEDWVAAVESIFQIAMLQVNTRDVQHPHHLKQLIIRPDNLSPLVNKSVFNVSVDKKTGTISTYAIQMSKMTFSYQKPKKEMPDAVFDKFSFVPYISAEPLEKESVTQHCAHLIMENITSRSPRIIEVRSTSSADNLLIHHFDKAVTKVGGQCELAVSGVTNAKDAKEIKNVDHEPDEMYDVIITDTKYYHNNPTILRLLRSNGFIIVIDKFEDPMEIPEYVVCYDACWPSTRLVMYKKERSYKKYVTIDLDLERTNDWLTKLQETLTSPQKIILLSRSKVSGIIGFVYSLLGEVKAENLRCMLILDEDAPVFSPDTPYYSQQLRKGLVFNILKKQEWGSFKLSPITPKMRFSHSILAAPYGLVRAPSNRSIARDNNRCISVYYTALGSEALNSELTGEYISFYSGRDQVANRTMGIYVNTYGPIHSTISETPNFCWEVPEDWSLLEAAAAVNIYSKAYCLLRDVENGSAVLITSAYTPVGVAMMSICLTRGCPVFACCSTPSEANCLRRHFTDIHGSNIYSAQDTCLFPEIMAQTCNVGVDVVILQKGGIVGDSLLALRPGGILIRADSSCDVDSKLLPGNVTLITMNYFSFLKEVAHRQYLTENIEKLGRLGLKAPMRRFLSLSELFSNSGSNFPCSEDKISVVKLKSEEKITPNAPASVSWEVNLRCWFDAAFTYIIVGGLGGFAVELIPWMIQRGARKFLLSVRSGVKNGYQSYLIKHWLDNGIQLTISSQDIINEEGAHSVIREAMSSGPVGGIFHLAGIYEQLLVSNLTTEIFDRVNNAKITSARHFDKWSRKLCPDIRHFVLFSSAASSRNCPGVAAYSHASSAVERLAEKRVSEGFPAKAIEWGIIGDVGMGATRQDIHFDCIGVQPIASCLGWLDFLLLSRPTVVTSMVVEKRKVVEKKTNVVKTRIIELMNITNIESLAKDTPLSSLGMDSILTMIVKNVLEDEFKICKSIVEVRNLTIEQLNTL